MNYDSVYNLSYRLAKQLTFGTNSNTETILGILKDLLRSCQGLVIDSKRILGSITKLTHIKDVRVKKLVYLYLSFVTDEDSEIWLHVMNSVSNDLAEPNPIVRRSALLLLTDSHSVSDSLNEIRVGHVAKRLKDPNPTVRKYAVAGIQKLITLFNLRKVDFDMSSILDDIAQMIYLDDDPTVIVECIHSLQSCRKQNLKTDLLLSLLGKMEMMELWTKAEIINLFSKISDPYKMTHEEIFQALNLIDVYLDRKFPMYLSLSCAAAMLLVSKRFSNIHCDVKARVLEYLITQTSLVPNHMKHLHLTVLDTVLDQRSAPKLVPYYKSFLPLPSDDAYEKVLKLRILRKVCTKKNAQHLFRAVTSIIMTSKEKELVHFAMGTLISVHDHIPAESEAFLLSILKHNSPNILDAAVLVLWRIVFSKKESNSVSGESVTDALIFTYEKLSSFDTKSAFFSFMCSFTQKHHSKRLLAIVEREISMWRTLKLAMFKLTLLRTAMTLYFLSPAHFQAILGKVLCLASHDENLLVCRQALAYFNLLKHDVDAAKKYVSDLAKLKHCGNLDVTSSPEKLKSLCLISLEPS